MRSNPLPKTDRGAVGGQRTGPRVPRGDIVVVDPAPTDSPPATPADLAGFAQQDEPEPASLPSLTVVFGQRKLVWVSRVDLLSIWERPTARSGCYQLPPARDDQTPRTPNIEATTYSGSAPSMGSIFRTTFDGSDVFSHGNRASRHGQRLRTKSVIPLCAPGSTVGSETLSISSDLAIVMRRKRFRELSWLPDFQIFTATSPTGSRRRRPFRTCPLREPGAARSRMRFRLS